MDHFFKRLHTMRSSNLHVSHSQRIVSKSAGEDPSQWYLGIFIRISVNISPLLAQTHAESVQPTRLVSKPSGVQSCAKLHYSGDVEGMVYSRLMAEWRLRTAHFQSWVDATSQSLFCDTSKALNELVLNKFSKNHHIYEVPAKAIVDPAAAMARK